MTAVFIGIIWISQILRLLDMQFISSSKYLDLFITTFYVLPSYINPLFPILVIFSSIGLNFKFINNNEILVFNQYLNSNHFTKMLLLFLIIFVGLYFLNNELISKKTYAQYKINELDIRNNLKLGLTGGNEFHVKDEFSLFFKNSDNQVFKKVKAIIYNNNQFVISKSAKLSFDKNNFVITFYNGQRILLNQNEKSSTKFDKFTYNIEKTAADELHYDKDHFNTYELLNSKQNDFYAHGHNKIYQYFFLITLIAISIKVIFYKSTSHKFLDNYIILIMLVFFVVLINSYLQNLLMKENISLIFYYLINLLTLNCLIIFSFKKYANH